MARVIYFAAVVLPNAIPGVARETGFDWLDGLLTRWGWFTIAVLISILGITYLIGRRAYRLEEERKPRIVIAYDPESASSATLVMRHIKIEVQNTGAEILHNCVVNLEDLTPNNGQPRTAALITEMQEGRTGGEFTLRPNQKKYIEVARLNEQAQDDIALQYESREFQRTIPRNNTYYFHLFAYSERASQSKRFKLYVDNDGRLRMEECQ